MVKHLYIMRHGETLFNVYHRIQGWCDSPLTLKGIEEANKAKHNLQTIAFDHYYSSTSQRACDTLEIVTDHKENYVRLKGLREYNFGVFEGLSEDLCPPFERYNDVFPLYGGETTEGFCDRIMKTLSEIMAKEDHQEVFVVSHSGVAIAFLKYVKNFSLKEKFSNCETIHLSYDNGEFTYIEKLKL